MYSINFSKCCHSLHGYVNLEFRDEFLHPILIYIVQYMVGL